MDISLWSDEELVEELIDVLKAMALQYLSDLDGDVMTHDFMQAGEGCLKILAALGIIKTDDDVYYAWVKGSLN